MNFSQFSYSPNLVKGSAKSANLNIKCYGPNDSSSKNEIPEGIKVIEYGGLTTDLKLGNNRRQVNPIMNELIQDL